MAIQQVKQTAEEERNKRNKAAAVKAQEIWTNCQPVPKNHEYFERKGINPPARVDKFNNVVLPVQDIHGEIHSLQMIAGNGQKRFLRDGKISGHFYFLKATERSEQIFIAEGVATAASIYQALEQKSHVVAAFNAGNLKNVALVFRRQYPGKKIVIAADNDQKKEKNVGLDKAKEAAKAVDGYLTWPEFKNSQGDDFNDLALVHGLEAVKFKLENSAQKFFQGSWPELIPFSDYTLPKITCDHLPGWAGTYAKELAETIQVPEELAVSCVLGALSLAATGAINNIEIKPGYSETLNLYILATLMSGERKTATLNGALKVFYSWMDENRHEQIEEIMKTESTIKSLQRIIEQKRKNLHKITDQTKQMQKIKEIAEEEKKLPEVPTIPRLIADDCTPEQLPRLLRDNNETLGICSAEGGIFDTIAGRYSKGIPNLDLFLKAHCGEPSSTDRVGRAAITLQNPKLVLCLCPQREIMENLSSKEGFRGRGLIARFLYLLPESKVGYRKVETRKIATNIVDEYEKNIRYLLNMRGKEITLYLDKDAYGLWAEFSSHVEKELRDSGDFEQIRDWAGKLPGTAARIAGLFHCVENDITNAQVVSAKNMQMALDLSASLADHAREAIAQMGCDHTRKVAVKIISWIRSAGTEEFTARQCFRALQGSFKTQEEIDSGLKSLETRGYVRTSQKQTNDKGRPYIEYTVNPEVFK